MTFESYMYCRLEANYGFQVGLDMIPLMMQQGYTAKGWLGLILGTRLWYHLRDVTFPIVIQQYSG